MLVPCERIRVEGVVSSKTGVNGTNCTWLIICTCEIAVEWSIDLGCVLTVHVSSYVITSKV